MNKIIECVPNFSEGRDKEKIEKIVDCFRNVEGVKLLDYSSDEDHNRSVVTVIGEPAPLKDAMVAAIGKAVELIDMTKHQGQHPRMGCVDVVPFIPIRNTTVEEADALAKEVAKEASEKFGQPFFLYEKSATAPHRENLAKVRQGQFEGMAEKMKDQEKWKPDFGPNTIHPTGGVTAIGARMPLIAYNINLDTSNVEIAQKIADKIRHVKGGFRYCKAMGVMLEDRNIAQVSMNLTDYTKTSVYTVFETVRMEARRYGVNVLGSEVVGLIPLQARSVVTVIGEPAPLKDAMVAAIGKAVELIDMTKHQGQHPRMGCVDVVPFIPIRNTTVEEADALAKEVAKEASEKFGQPFFLYEKSATAPHRENLAKVRQGQFEGMAEKMKDQEKWKPDFGPNTIHPTGGVTAIGARMPLIAYNINLDTSNVEIAQKIADKIRHVKGGFRYCKAMGVMLEDRNIAQVSMNLTDYTKTSVYTVFETVRMEARRYGVNVLGSEVVGLIPLQAIVDCAEYYLGFEGFDPKQVLETRL